MGYVIDGNDQNQHGCDNAFNISKRPGWTSHKFDNKVATDNGKEPIYS